MKRWTIGAVTAAVTVVALSGCPDANENRMGDAGGASASSGRATTGVATGTGGSTTTGTGGSAASTGGAGGGACVPACATGLTCCNGACALSSDDPKNCGACGVVCAADAVCADSKCRCGAAGPLCSAGSTCCDATCVKLATDAANCGKCGKACSAGATCSMSACSCGGGADCGGGEACCGGLACKDVVLDPANCGVCGNACVPGETCAASVCACAGALGGKACPPGDTCSASGCSDWTDWAMPNPVSTGLPHPDSYSPFAGYVLDNVTGLWWQQPIDVNNDQGKNCSAGCLQAHALAYCRNLTLAGHADWRLPSRIELVSIVDFTVSSPSINGTQPWFAPWRSTPGCPVSKCHEYPLVVALESPRRRATSRSGG